MLRNEFIKICLFSGIATVSGIATSEAEELPADLNEALASAGLTKCRVVANPGVLKIRAHVANLEAFARKAGALGDGQVRVTKNTLIFERTGQRMELSFSV